jgi:hypothetical protein
MTDTITLPRATVQQALERLMLHHRTWDARDDLNAITALRAALEQPEQPVQEPLKPNATTRLQDPGAYDRGVLAGLRQALAICSDLENFAADRLAWDIQDAIAALRAALEQPDRAQKMRDAGYTRRPTLREMAEPEQEPVAWLELRILSSGGYASPIKEWHVTQNPSTSNALRKPLYTHPPRREWRSLSEEEILPLYSMLPSSHAEMLEFSRAFEAALRSKNHE